MLVTSFTSSVAFFACITSPIMPIRSFGVFSFIIVLNCFLITILVQPINYFIYEKYIHNIGWQDQRLAQTHDCKRREDDESDSDFDDINYEDFIQKENSGSVQKFFDGKASKYVYKFRFFIFSIGLLLSINHFINTT